MTDLVPLPQLGGMPTPAELRAVVVAAIQQGYADAYQRRGAVHAPEDTYALQRRLAYIDNQLADFANAFTAARKLVGQLQAEELVEAVGEQQEIPNGAVVVPDPDGDLRIGPDYANIHTIDAQQVMAAVISDAMSEPDGRPTAERLRAVIEGDEGDPGDVEEILADMALRAHHTTIGLGSFTMQVAKVRGYARQLALRGLDKAASVVTGAIATHQEYKGVKISRKAPR